MGERAIVGLCGTKGSGKSTAAKHLKKVYGAVILSFASPLKKACQVLFGFHPQQLYGTDLQKQTMDSFLGVSARDMLQFLGTEVFRNNKLFAVENETIWIANMRERIAAVDPLQDIVIDDVRFPDEAQMIASFKGMTFCIQRPTKEVEMLELEEDAVPPFPTEFAQGSAPAELASNPLYHALCHVVPGWTKKTDWDQSVMMSELERELNMLPGIFPNLPWMGKGYTRRNMSDAKTIMYPDFMSFWVAMRHQTLMFREPTHVYTENNQEHASEKIDFKPDETLINDCSMEEFEERVFALIPIVHTREAMKEAEKAYYAK